MYNDYQNNNRELKYFIYARKSSEDKNKQIASIPAQIKELKAIALKENINIVDIITEEKSAKAPGRDGFNKMVERIHKGESNAILCWKLDRLSRNPVDGGTVSWLIQQGIVQNIKTHSRDYYPSDNVLMMQVELGMANQFIRDLSDNTKRGMRKRIEDGWYLGKAPIGYLNIEGPRKTRIIDFDPTKKAIIRNLFDQFMTGNHSIESLRNLAVNEYGLRSGSGKKLSKSSIGRMLTNPFYMGKFEYPTGSGILIEGKHQNLITKREYDRVQDIISGRGRPRKKVHTHAFTGLLRCGECGCSITADPPRVKFFKKTKPRIYKYYHCTKKRDDLSCNEPSIEEKELTKQFKQLVSMIDLKENVSDWVISKIKLEKAKVTNDTKEIATQLNQKYQLCVDKIDKLVDKNLEGLMSDYIYKEKMDELEDEKKTLLKNLNELDDEYSNRIDTIIKAFNFAKNLNQLWDEGGLEEKKLIMSTLGSNLFLKHQKVFIQMSSEFQLISKHQKQLNSLSGRIEPVQNALQKDVIEGLNEQEIIWGDQWGSNPRQPLPQSGALPTEL